MASVLGGCDSNSDFSALDVVGIVQALGITTAELNPSLAFTSQWDTCNFSVSQYSPL